MVLVMGAGILMVFGRRVPLGSPMVGGTAMTLTRRRQCRSRVGGSFHLADTDGNAGTRLSRSCNVRTRIKVPDTQNPSELVWDPGGARPETATHPVRLHKPVQIGNCGVFPCKTKRRATNLLSHDDALTYLHMKSRSRRA
jgi:hypothetical protein